MYQLEFVFKGRGKRGPLSELTGSMKKINRIISFSKRKPPLPGDPPSSSDNQDNTCTGERNHFSQEWLIDDTAD